MVKPLSGMELFIHDLSQCNTDLHTYTCIGILYMYSYMSVYACMLLHVINAMAQKVGIDWMANLLKQELYS